MIKTPRTIRVKKLSDEKEDDLKQNTPAERWAMMWQLTLDARAFKGKTLAESRLPRHIARVYPTSKLNL